MRGLGNGGRFSVAPADVCHAAGGTDRDFVFVVIA